MKSAFFICSIFSLIISCKKANTETCNSGPVPYKSLKSEYGCSNNSYATNINGVTFVIIRNQTDFNNTVIGSCKPNVDFSTYDLVIGQKQLTSGCREIIYDLSKDCQSNTVTVNVTMKTNFTTEAPQIFYNCLLPKLQPNENVTVNVVVQ